MLFTDSEKLAQKYDFEKKEQFVFSKKIAKDQIESIRILQKPIKEFEAYGVKETIIEKEDIDAWLNSIFLLLELMCGQGCLLDIHRMPVEIHMDLLMGHGRAVYLIQWNTLNC